MNDQQLEAFQCAQYVSAVRCQNRPVDGTPYCQHHLMMCPVSLDGKHSWRFDGDDPYILCHWCGKRRDVLTGKPVVQ